jgi:hypothetical protein
MAPMDPQYVSALREAKSLLDDGVFSQKEFEDEKQILKQRFHVSQPGVPGYERFGMPASSNGKISDRLPDVLSMPSGYILFAQIPILSSTGKKGRKDQALSAT